MTTKKIVSIVTSIALLSGALCAAPLQQGSTSLFSAPIVAEAAAFTSGVKTNLVYNCSCNNTKMFFRQDPSDKHLEVCGCETNGPVTGPMTIPSTFKVNGVNYPVTAIGVNAFMNQTNIRCVNNFSGTITTIGQGAFYGCTNLNSCQFTDSQLNSTIKTIGHSAFEGCSSLPGIDGCIENATEIGNHAFWGCTSLTEITLKKVTSLGFAAFYDCSGLKKVDLSQLSLTTLKNHTFANCTSLNELHLPETLKTIEVHAVNNCDALEKIYIPDSVTSIGTAAFMSCDSLKTVMMSENISTIGDHAFFECPNMKYFVSKKKNAYIGDWAVGWHLENGLPVKNKDFVIWSTGSGNVKNYATNYGITFRQVSTAASAASDRFAKYEWARCGFDFDSWFPDGTRYFTEKHKQYVHSSWINQPNPGFMGSLEAVSVLTSSGYLSVSDYAAGYTALNNMTTIPKKTSSYVSTINAHVNISSDNADYYSAKKFSKEMLRYAEYITYGADAAVMLTRKNSCAGYFTACFGMEFKANAADKNDACWEGWDARLLIYKPDTRRTHNKADYVYVNLSDGSWRVNNVTNAGSYSFMMNHRPETVLISYKQMTMDQFLAAIRN